jgi:hypothetical protein
MIRVIYLGYACILLTYADVEIVNLSDRWKRPTSVQGAMPQLPTVKSRLLLLRSKALVPSALLESILLNGQAGCKLLPTETLTASLLLLLYLCPVYSVILLWDLSLG